MNQLTQNQFQKILDESDLKIGILKSQVGQFSPDTLANELEMIQYKTILDLFFLTLKRVDEVEAKLDRVLLKE